VETATSVLFLQILFATMLVLVIALISHTIADQMVLNHQSLRATLAWAFSIGPPPSSAALYGFGPIELGFWIGLSMITGVWLGSCFPQWRWWTLILGWSAILITAMNAGIIAWALFMPLAILADNPARYPGPSLEQWSALLRVVGATTLTSLVCIPIGLPVRNYWRHAASRRWKKLLLGARRTRRQS